MPVYCLQCNTSREPLVVKRSIFSCLFFFVVLQIIYQKTFLGQKCKKVYIFFLISAGSLWKHLYQMYVPFSFTAFSPISKRPVWHSLGDFQQSSAVRARSRTKEMQPAWRCLLICKINLEPVPSTLQNKLGCTPPSVCHNTQFKKLKLCLEFSTDAADNECFGNCSQSQFKVFCLKEKLPHSLSPLAGNIVCQLSSYQFCRWSVSGPTPHPSILLGAAVDAH